MSRYSPEYDRKETKHCAFPDYPASTDVYYKNDEIVKTSFTDEKQKYSRQEVFENGQLIYKEENDPEEYRTQYFKDGKLHNDNEPAVVIRDLCGFEFQYYKDGLLHREDGPAKTFTKTPHLNEWYIEGKKLSSAEIFVHKLKNIRKSFLGIKSDKISNKLT